MKRLIMVIVTTFVMLIASILTAAAEKVEAPVYENNLIIAVVNFQPVWGDKETNLKKILDDTIKAADNGAKIIVFPEMALTGYAVEQGDNIKRIDRMQVKLAEKFDGASAQAVAKIAKAKGVYVVYGYPESKGDDPLIVYNSVLVAGPTSIIGSYQKIHPFGGEVLWAKSGTTPFLFDTQWGPVGVSVCFDTQVFPELMRYYGASGARLVLNPTATTYAYLSKNELINGRPINDGKPINGNNLQWVYRFKAFMEAHVMQSSLFIASANLVGAETSMDGKYMGTAWPGGSSVVGPNALDLKSANFIGYYGTNPATATDAGIIYSTLNLSNATRGAFENYIKTDMQEGYLYNPALYSQWFDSLAKGKYAK